MIVRSRSTLAYICAGIAFGVAVLAMFVIEEKQAWIKPLSVAWFAAFGGLFLLHGIRRPVQFEIRQDCILVQGLCFSLSNIREARVVKTWFRGSYFVCLQVHLVEMPELPLLWRISNHLKRFALPKSWDDGTPLAPEPRMLFSLSSPDIPYSEINAELLKVLAHQGSNR